MDKAWSSILQRSGAEVPSKAKYLVAHDSGVGHGRTHFMRHETFWIELLESIKDSGMDQARLDVLVTACSVGAEVYDAARIAKTLGVENIYFHGHDKSAKFIERAQEGIYPRSSILNIPDNSRWFTHHDPCHGYATIRAEQFKNVDFLPPSDIRHLSGEFDIAVENIMNPCPVDIEELMIAKARHMAIASYDVVKTSDQFKPVAAGFKTAIRIKAQERRDQATLKEKSPDTNAPGL